MRRAPSLIGPRRAIGGCATCCETKQGLSHARNAGIAAARAPIIAFTDDDVRVGPDWLAAIMRTVRAYPGVSVVGGKVLPIWPAPPPPWLTPEHWGPLALVDYGEQPVRVDADNPLCLVGREPRRRAKCVRPGRWIRRRCAAGARQRGLERGPRVPAAPVRRRGLWHLRSRGSSFMPPFSRTGSNARTTGAGTRAMATFMRVMRPEYLERSRTRAGSSMCRLTCIGRRRATLRAGPGEAAPRRRRRICA